MGQGRWNAPQALQIWFPTSSLLQKGITPVPQFAQISAPAATRPWILVGWDRGTIRLAFGEPGPTETSAGTSSIKFLVVGTLFRCLITIFLIEFGQCVPCNLKNRPAWITDPNKWNDRDADVSANVLGGKTSTKTERMKMQPQWHQLIPPRYKSIHVISDNTPVYR